MITFYLTFVAASFALGLVADTAGPLAVAITLAEVAVIATVLRTVLIPALKLFPAWSTMPRPVQLILVAIVAAIACALEAYATGKPPLLAVLTGVASLSAALAAFEGDRQHAVRKQELGDPT